MSRKDVLEVPAGKALKIPNSQTTDYVVKDGDRLKVLTPTGQRPISRGAVIEKTERSTFCENVPREAAEDAAREQPLHSPADVEPNGDVREVTAHRPATSPAHEGARAPPARTPSRDDLDSDPLVVATDADSEAETAERTRLNAR
jgi:hypothetical protein